MSDQSRVQPARITWDEDGQPLSSRYGDVYFSRNNGLAESRYVFLQQNHLAERWQAGWEQETFYIGETGFGSGLNFLAAWQLWTESKPRPDRLHFISVENEPLQREDLVRALSLWPELAPLAEEFIALYPQLPLEGFHNFSLADGKVRLTLIIDDAIAGLRQLLRSDHPDYRLPFHRGMDAWFLDGFAPAKNPEMWQPPLFNTIAAMSNEGCTLATFTAAGMVRRELQRVGFQVEKRPGYGYKREMVAAVFSGGQNLEAEESGDDLQPWHVCIPKASTDKEAIVIGAGLAGCHTARALAERGWRVRVLDAAEEAATGASGNPQGIVYGKLSPDDDAPAQFNLAALRRAQQVYEPLWRQGGFGEQCGVLVVPRNEKDIELHKKVATRYGGDSDFIRLLSSEEAAEVAGIPVDHPALFYPKLGWIKPPALCGALLDHPNILLQTGAAVGSLYYDATAGRWQLDGFGESSKVVIANANDALNFEQVQHLPLKAIRGQVSYFCREQIPLRTVVCGEGYIAPACNGDSSGAVLQSFGATFTLHEHSPAVLAADHQSNLDNLAKLFAAPIPRDAQTVEELQGRTAFRCTTADYLPIVGPAPDYEAFVDRYRILSRNARAKIDEAGVFLPGLYLNVGHGSRGLAYAALAGEVLAAQMDGDLLPVARSLAVALNPGRFIIRDLIRRRIADNR